MEWYRGDVIFVTKSKIMGSDQNGDRPAVIVSNNIGNHHSDSVEVVFMTTSKKTSLPTHVEIICNELSTVQCEQIFTIPKDRIKNLVRTCTKAEMKKIDKALAVSLALTTDDAVETTGAKADFEPDAKYEELKATFERVEKDLVASQKNVFELKDTIKRMSENGIKLMTERDVFKSLYEDLLKKVTG